MIKNQFRTSGVRDLHIIDVEIARTYDTTVYDAAFAALAEGSDAAFLTADERLARQLNTFPFVHFLGEVGEGMRL